MIRNESYFLFVPSATNMNLRLTVESHETLSSNWIFGLNVVVIDLHCGIDASPCETDDMVFTIVNSYGQFSQSVIISPHVVYSMQISIHL